MIKRIHFDNEYSAPGIIYANFFERLNLVLIYLNL